MIAVRSTFQSGPRPIAGPLPPHEFSIDVLRSGTVAVLGVAGHLSGAGSQRLRRTLDQLISDGTREFTVHLDTSGSPDSTCLRVLLETRIHLVPLCGELAVTSRSAATRTLLAMVGLAQQR